MKSHRLAIGLLVSLLVVSAVVAVAWWEDHRLIYPTPETESAFLRNYTPAQTIDRFRENEFSGTLRNMAAGAGLSFVHREGGFDFYVVLRREKWIPLMNALRNDALQQLANSGAEVLSQGGNPTDGFHFDYRANKSIGRLTVCPLAITPSSLIRRNMVLPQGMEDVTVTIEQIEQWFPKGGVTIQPSSTTIVHSC
jgi:hypothetical protein